ncbi:MAG: hypothetical protein NVV59_00895 [Chitinophagaceae bacterium]|nr:hypothetical protein [Chitinophagaceae bacterium]
MNYLGESLFPGQLGHFLIILSFFASLVASIAYYKSTRLGLEKKVDDWKKLARFFFHH